MGDITRLVIGGTRSENRTSRQITTLSRACPRQSSGTNYKEAFSVEQASSSVRRKIIIITYQEVLQPTMRVRILGPSIDTSGTSLSHPGLSSSCSLVLLSAIVREDCHHSFTPYQVYTKLYQGTCESRYGT